MAKYNYDLFVIGGGSGGVRAARWSAGLGAKVGICEEDQFGGTCVIRGCVPKKLMIYASEVAEEIEGAKSYGWTVGDAKFDWAKFKHNRDKEIQRLGGLYEKMLQNNGVEILKGKGVLIDTHTVKVGKKEVTAEKILIATGGKPSVPDLQDVNQAWTSNDIFTSEHQPKSLLIVGGGFIAVEFAGIFHGLGTKVTMLIRGDYPLRGFDDDCRKFLCQELKRKKLDVRTCLGIKQMKQTEDGFQVEIDDGLVMDVEQILFATGRSPNTKNIGLESVGVKTEDNGAVIVNEKYQTSVPSIYAIGDCTDRVNLTPVALAEGTLLAESWFGNKELEIDYSTVPSTVFSQPPLATVGITEQQAKEKGIDYEVYESDFRALKHTLSGLEERTYMKMIVDKSNQKVLGIHMVGKDAGEIMQGLGICVRAGLTKSDFDRTIGIHPTSAEEFVTMRTPRSN